MTTELRIIFIRGKAATYHLLPPFEPIGWSKEALDKLVPVLCGKAMPKQQANILSDLTNLYFCKICQKLAKLQDLEWADRITERISQMEAA